MKQRTFDDLVRHLRNQRELGEHAPVLLLGAGASREAGIEDMQGLFTLVEAANFDQFVTYIDDRGESERYSLLARYLSTRSPEQITDGYRALAALCAAAYFDIVLTTNLDPLLDDAMVEADLWRRDYALIINGLLRADRIGPVLSSDRPRVKIVKLHGDLYWRLMAWTPTEMDAYVADIEPLLAPVLARREVLVVGQSLRDEHVRQLVLETDNIVWFATPGSPPEHLSQYDQVLAVEDARSRFETLFPTLAEEFGISVRYGDGERGLRAGPISGVTTDDLLHATVAIGDHEGEPSGTGFLLSEPRVIVTDPFAIAPTRSPGDTVPVRLADGRQLKLPISRQGTHPFGPVVLETPTDVDMPGLELAASEPLPGARVSMAVAAGTATGLSDGTVVTANPPTYDIQPLGQVHGLVELRARVAPGSSGAPVVDDAKRAVGMIVAGGKAPENPMTLMLPVSQWSHLVDT